MSAGATCIIVTCFCLLLAIVITIPIVVIVQKNNSATPAPTPAPIEQQQQLFIEEDPTARSGRSQALVIIGGAGIAGIELARELDKAGVDFLILEASNRVGGRISEFRFGGYTLERGANWIQGLRGNPVWDLKKEYGLKGVRNDFDDIVVFDADGTEVEAPYEDEAGAAADEAYVGAGRISRRCLQPSKPTDLNPATRRFCADKIPGFVNARPDDDLSNARGETLFNGFVANTSLKRAYQYYSQDFEWAEAPQITSLNNTLPANSYVDFADANYMALDDPLGYARLVLKHGATFLRTSVNSDTTVKFNDARLQLRTRVLDVDYSAANKVRVTVCTTTPSALHSGTRYPCAQNSQRVVEGSHFVSTFSVGVLQQSPKEARNTPLTQRTSPRFTPAFSSAKESALAQYPMALYSKIFFRFPWKFWQESQMLLTAFGDGTFAPVWQSLDMEGFLPDSNIYFVTVTGERARDLQELPNSAATDTLIINQLLPVLNQLFPDAIRALTGGRLLRRADVLEFSMTRWLQDDLARGMYSNWRVNRTWAQQEATRANVGRLWLSGEHTCFRYNGYTHGGLLAGRRTARLLLRDEFGKRNVDAGSLCDNSPEQLGGGGNTILAVAKEDYEPHSLGFPRNRDRDVE